MIKKCKMKLNNNLNFGIIFVAVNLFFACSSSPKTEKNDDEQSETVKELLYPIEQKSEEIQVNVEEFCDIDIMELITQLANDEKFSDENILRLLKSPANFALEYVCPLSCWISYYVFYDDNTVTVDSGDSCWVSGKWTLDNNNLVLLFNKQEGKRGIGKPNNAIEGVPSHYIYTYDEYVPFVEVVDFSEQYNWVEEVQNISKKFSNFDCVGFTRYSLLEDNAKAERVVLPGKYTFASEKELTKEMLSNYNKEQLRIIRNEIFARYGYIFKSNDLKKYFGQQSWYDPKRENVDKYLSEREQKNIILLIEAENEAH